MTGTARKRYSCRHASFWSCGPWWSWMREAVTTRAAVLFMALVIRTALVIWTPLVIGVAQVVGKPSVIPDTPLPSNLSWLSPQ